MATGRRRILCAESKRDVAELIALMLGRRGYEVVTTETAAETLRVAAGEPFDLFILNDTYEDADSFDLMKGLRKEHPSTPVLLFSLERSGGDRRRAEAAGAHYYESRTSDFTALVQTIDSLIGSA